MQTAWPDERYEQGIRVGALACLELLTDEPRWIHRRVETIDLLAQELVRRQVTVDFTLPEALLEDLRIGPDGPWCRSRSSRKRPLRNFDLREHDEWRSILGASWGGPIATHVVTAATRLAAAPAAQEPEVASLLALIARSDLEDARASIVALRGRTAHSPQIATILADDTSGYFLATFAESYMLVALLADARGRRILRYAYDEQLQPGGRASRAPARATAGLSPVVVDVASRPRRTRRPTTPRSSCRRSCGWTRESRRADRGAALDGPRARRRPRVAARSAGHARRRAAARRRDQRRRADLPTLAFATSAVTALLLLLGAAFGDLGSATAGSSVTLLLAGSVLFATAVARGGEHRLMRGIFAGPRRLAAVGRRAGGARRRRERCLRRRRRPARRRLVLRRGHEPACMSQPGGSLLPSSTPDATPAWARRGRRSLTVMFSELAKILADTGKLAPGGRPAASFVVRSAEGRPNRNLSIDARAPKPITRGQAKGLRENRAA